MYFIRTSSSESMFKVHCQAIVRMSLVRKRSAQRIAISSPNRGEGKDIFFSYYPNICFTGCVAFQKVRPFRRRESVPPLRSLLERSSVGFKGICAPLTGLLRGHFVLIVVEVFPAEEETELRVVLLLVLSHLLKLGPIPCDKLRQFVYDVP